MEKHGSKNPSNKIACPKCGATFATELSLLYCGVCGTDLHNKNASSNFSDTFSKSSDPLAEDPLLGQVVAGRYKVLKVLGQGGMGKVYLVEHQEMGKRMAMKVLHRELASNKDLIRRFRREALAVSRLASPHTVQVFDFGQDFCGTYLAMELLRGEDLGQILKKEQKLPLLRTIDLINQTTLALEEAHNQGIVHRDLKPENLFIVRSPLGNDFLKVLDFGLAKLQSGANEETGRGKLLGTPYYMAPEQIRGGKIDARTDVYALGALFHKMLTGEPPYEADSPLSVLSRHISDSIPKMRAKDPEIPKAADKVLQRLLAKKPADRPQSVKEVRELFTELLENPTFGETGDWEKESALQSSSDSNTSLEKDSTLFDSENRATRADWEEFVLKQRKKRTRFVVAFLCLSILALGVFLFRHHLWPQQETQAASRRQEQEPNNDYRTSNKILPEQTLQGFLGKRIDSKTPDRDIYRLEIGETGEHMHRITAEVSGIPNINIQLDIVVEENGFAKTLEPSGDANGKGEGETLTKDIKPDLAYIMVRQVTENNTVVENVSDRYQLRIQVSHPHETESPETNPFSAPRPLTPGQDETGYIGSYQDSSVYRLTQTGRAISVQVLDIPNVDIVLGVYDAEQNEILLKDENSTGKGEEINSLRLPTGEPPFLVIKRKAIVNHGTNFTIKTAIR